MDLRGFESEISFKLFMKNTCILNEGYIKNEVFIKV